ncbi:MAG: aminopeptidase [Caldimicrobium sp.]|nr:aminopeptidase [Caldimicrobium sp.]MCX7612665.1 aminopeptidase [Caldimicrobium sp.]MDW8182182.1 aminopeptidase [Caldimicrobium sp.]
MKNEHVFDLLKEEEVERVDSLSKDYVRFLTTVKTERVCVENFVDELKKRGFDELNPKQGFFTYRNKFLACWKSGTKPLTEGIKIIVSHIDTPRLDLKLHPLFEEMDLSFLKTHYYGGIKKYHWVAMPLALHGIVVKRDGSSVKIRIGEEDNEPVFTICDLLPHLGRKKQEEKKLSEAIPAENLNILFGGIPFEKKAKGKKEEKERVKKRILKILEDRYGITEADFVSAEIFAVPAGQAKFVGLDEAFIGGYGQDDRVCAFTSFRAFLEVTAPSYTTLVLFMDREEIGSEGNTSAKSRIFEKLIYRLIKAQGLPPTPDNFFEIMHHTKALSADVTAGIDPNYLEVHDKLNDAKVGYGVVISRYTGHGGKYMANEAHAEYMGYLRDLFEKKDVVYQVCSMGKVDEGGGGTVSKYFASYGMDIVDIGPPLLSMHSPFEILHKGDLYMTYKAFKVFLES